MHVIANVMYYQAPLLLFQAKQQDTMTSKWIITLWLLIEKWLLVILLELFWRYFDIMIEHLCSATINLASLEISKPTASRHSACYTSLHINHLDCETSSGPARVSFKHIIKL